MNMNLWLQICAKNELQKHPEAPSGVMQYN